MIKMEKFLISKRPYAADLSSLTVTEQSGFDRPSYYNCRIQAVWFRRRSGLTVACIGTLWDYQDVKPVDGEAFLRAHDDGRYGGDTQGRWDGDGYWGNVSLVRQQEHLAILVPMLENYPEVPDSFDGWWKF